MAKTDKLNELLVSLAEQGCYPSIYRRGTVWRAHVNAAGNWWEESICPLGALQSAVEAWAKSGRPMDGMAVEAATKHDPR